MYTSVREMNGGLQTELPAHARKERAGRGAAYDLYIDKEKEQYMRPGSQTVCVEYLTFTSEKPVKSLRARRNR